MKLFSYLTLAVASIIILAMSTSCNKDAADWTYSTDNTMSELSFDDLYNVSSGEINNNSSLRSCGTITVDTTAGTWFPVTITFDFGTNTYCAGDGRTRSGIITAVMTDRWSTQGMTCTITTSNYVVDGYKVEGTNTITHSTTTLHKYESVVTNGKVTELSSGAEITRTSTKYWTWISGSSTPLDVTDDVWQLEGTASGTTRNGNAFTANITTPVVKAQSCKWVQDGRVEVVPASGGNTYAVDYSIDASGASNADCDKYALLSYGNWTFNYEMP